MQSLLAKLMAKDPKDRFKSTSELLSVLTKMSDAA